MVYDLRYPIGKANVPDEPSFSDVTQYIREISDLPPLLRSAVEGLSDAELDTPYREGGWTVRQVVHHLFDSHVNAYIRFKLALTEDNPTIKPYDQERWAQLRDAKTEPIDVSLTLLDALHRKMVAMFRAMSPAQLSRTFFHPEDNKLVRIDRNIGIYAWHGKHHLAHVQNLKDRMDWNQ